MLLGPGSAVQVGEDDPLLTGAQAPAAVPTAPVASPETILLTAAETKPDESPAGLLPTIAIGAAAPPALALTVEGSAAKPIGKSLLPNSQFSWDPDDGSSSSRQRVHGMPRVSGYELIRELGRGGMGVVYHARHRGLKREVALKMILSGVHASPEQLARFRAEAEAVAHLHHANIVQIYDVGQHDGLPFFSLEFVDGQPLDKLLAGQPQTEESAAQMIETLARAVHHAHEHGIVHRDLKPANVLLTKSGVPKVTDFGLVKRLEEDDASQTRTGTIMGTPSFMAPEQGRGDRDVGPLADVYSLGTILYVMLTGRPPFLAATLTDTLLALLNDEPVPPSRLRPKVSRDIETICLKCLQKGPERRYASALELAEDLRRLQKHEPILARPVGRLARVWRWCRRKPLVASLSATAAALAVTVLIGAPIAAVLIAVQRNEAIEARNRAQKMQTLAEKNASDASTAKEVAEKAKGEAEHQADRATKSKELAEKQRELAIAALDTLVNKVQNQLGDTARTYRLKREILESAFEGLKQVSAGSDAAGGQADPTMADAHQRMGRIFVDLGHPETALREYTSAHDLLRRLSDANPGDMMARYNLSRSAMRLGGVCLLVGDLPAAHAYSKQCLDLRLEIARERPVADVIRNLARAHVQMGEVLRDQERIEESRREFERARSLQEQLLGRATDKTRGGYEEDLRITHDRLGELHLLWIGEPEKSRQFYDQALKLARGLADADSASGVRARQNLAYAWSRLGTASQRLGDHAAASDQFQTSLALWEVLAREEDPEMLQVHGELALGLARAGRHGEAVAKADQLEKLSPEYPRNLYNVACCYALCAGAVAQQSAGAPDEAATPLRDQYVERAVQSLRKAISLGLEHLNFLKIDPDLDALRSEPAFRELIDSLGPSLRHSNATDHRAAIIDSRLPIRSTSPLRCIGWFGGV